MISRAYVNFIYTGLVNLVYLSVGCTVDWIPHSLLILSYFIKSSLFPDGKQAT